MAEKTPKQTGKKQEPSSEEAAEQAIDQAQDAVEALKAETDGDDVVTQALNLPDLQAQDGAGAGDPAALALLGDVDLTVKVELGRTRMYVEDVLRLNENSIIELDKLAGDPVDIYVNDRHVARGEVLVVNDNFCVRVSEIIQPTREGDS